MNNKGISMITLIITIIVIVILSGITMLISDSSIERSQRARKEAEIAQEKQILTVTLKDSENIFTGELEEDELEDGLQEYNAIIDKSYVPADPSKGEIKIIFNKTGNSYIIDKDGEITVLDRIYADNNTSDEPSTPDTPDTPDIPDTPDVPDTPSIPEGEEEYYMTVSGTNIEIIGNIENRISEGGMQFNVGTAFSYNDGYYYVAGKQGGWVGSQSEIPAFVNDRCVKLNVEKGFVTPGPDTVEGDMKLVGDTVYFYHPDDNRTDGYDIEAWWLEIPKNQKPV